MDDDRQMLVRKIERCETLVLQERARAEAAEAAEARVAALEKALFGCYTYSGADAGDEDDFRALVNKCDAVPDAVLDRREISDAAEARVAELEKALRDLHRSLLAHPAETRCSQCEAIAAAALEET